jgi:plastocyanin
MTAHRILISIAILTGACSGGATTTTPTAPSPPAPTPPGASAPPASPPTIVITATGMAPLEITIDVGQAVTFVNNDARSHDIVGGVDPAHPDCPEILVAGFLTPGQSRATAAFTSARTCEYHDHTALSVPAFQGRIIIR